MHQGWRAYRRFANDLIVDEIHLLHDELSPVLASAVAQMIQRMEQALDYVCLVGLLATLPNYKDVATFLRVDQSKGLFYFDTSSCSCALQQQFITVAEKKAIKRYQVMIEVFHEMVLDQAGKNPTLVFVH